MITFFKNALPLCLIIVFAMLLNACLAPAPPSPPLPSEGCQVAWADTAAAEFVDILEAATAEPHPVWPDYRLGDGPVVLEAGMNSDSTKHCLGVWQHGKVVDYKESADALKLATPLYGYQLSFKDLIKDDNLLKLSQQPASIGRWLDSLGMETAVVMPVDFPKFPFKLPALTKTQLAIHESFHVEVMLPFWYTGQGQWPAWDQQPDRTGSRQCYNLNENVADLFTEERNTLIQMIEALLKVDKAAATQAGNAFLSLRESRYAALGNLTINRQDSTQCNCAEAENMMELEEGLADYGSWTMLYEIGVATEGDLIQRYGALQNEPFYLTGAMLMHAISLMNPEGKEEVIKSIIGAPNHEEGALISQFRKTLAAYQ